MYIDICSIIHNLNLNVMKRVIKFFVAFVIVINATGFTYANDLDKKGNALKVIRKSDNLYNVVYQSKEDQQVSIQFIDEDQNVLYAEAISTSNGFIKPLDLSGLPAGSYQIRLVSSTDTLMRDIVVLTAEQLYADLIAVRSVGESQYALSIDEKVGKSLSLYIKDARGEILHSGEVDCSDSKVYDLTNLIGERATFMLYDGQDKVIEQNVEI